MPDLKCQMLLVGDPHDPSPYFPGRSFLLRSSMLHAPLALTGFQARRARLFAGSKDATSFLITLAAPFLKDPPSGPAHVLLGVGEEELDLHEIDVVSSSLSFKREGVFRVSTRVPLRSTVLLQEKASWTLPLLIPRRLPASLRLNLLGSSTSLSLWTRLT